MSSVQSFLRQRVVGTRTLSATGSTLYVFVAGNGNYIGNYPPGYMVAPAEAPVIAAGAVLRDMGKTIKAGISTNNGVSVGAPGFFREVQVIAPVSVASPTAASSFGVGVTGVGAGNGVPGALPAGGNPGDAGYCTYYIPIVVDGVVAAGASAPANALLPDGQL